MAFSRRIFLRHGILAAVASACNPFSAMALSERRIPIGSSEDTDPRKLSGAGSDSWQDHSAALNHLDRTAFSGAVGTNFKVSTAAGQSPVWVTLLAVEDLPALAPVNPASFAVPNKRAGSAPASSGFVLLFGGSSPVPQDTHLFEHQDLGRFALFTVPAGNGSQVHTAVVNRLDAVSFIWQGRPTAFSGASGINVQSSGGVKAPAATSSTSGTPSPGLAGSPAVQRDVLRD